MHRMKGLKYNTTKQKFEGINRTGPSLFLMEVLKTLADTQGLQTALTQLHPHQNKIHGNQILHTSSCEEIDTHQTQPRFPTLKP